MHLRFQKVWKIAISSFLFGSLNACSGPFKTPLLVHDDLLSNLTDEDFYPFQPASKMDADASEFNYKFHHDLNLKKYQNHKEVKKWVTYFTNKKSKQFETFLDRGSAYQKIISEILCRHNLPPDLFYLALIESGFNPTVSSHANAVGFWQFMAGTGKRFGLNIDEHIDERRDPIRSTEAAAKYLSRLYKVFNSWSLALAAYNSGESRVMNAIINQNERDFWNLSSIKALPKETRQYVPKLIAALIVGNRLEEFEIRTSKSRPLSIPKFDYFPGGSDLSLIAKDLGVRSEDLKSLNQNIINGITPPQHPSYKIWIPEDFNPLPSDVSVVNKNDIKNNQNLTAKKETKNNFKLYSIRKNDTLSEIAIKFKTSVDYLKKVNQLKSVTIVENRSILVPTY